MIHQVVASDKNDRALRQLLELQVSLLTFAASVDQTLVETTFEKSTLKPHLFSHFTSRYGRQDAEKVAQWVVQKGSLTAPLKTFANYDKASKEKIVQDIEFDISLLFSPRAEKLKFVLPNSLTEWHQSIKVFLLEFYELLGTPYTNFNGFPSFIFSDALGSVTFDRWKLIENFVSENRVLNLCAICDVSVFKTQVGERIIADIEHFFPKSRYPHLATHPRNLIPICKYCNSIASDKDILEFCSVGGITELLLPYQQTVKGLERLAYVEIQKQSVREKPPLVIQLKEARGERAATLIENFEKTYKVIDRWNNDFETIDSHVFRRIQQFFLPDVFSGNSLDSVEFVMSKLRQLVSLTSLDNLARDPYGFATTWFLHYHLTELAEKREESPIYKGLHSWAKDKDKISVRLKEHFDELTTRVVS